MVLSIFLFLGSYLRTDVPKCPEDFANDDAGYAEQMIAFEKWTNDFYDSHPGATLSDWNQARLQFYVDNDCTTTLERYKDMKEGRGDPVRQKIIRDALQEAVDARR